MKRFISLLIIVMFIFTLCACKGVEQGDALNHTYTEDSVQTEPQPETQSQTATDADAESTYTDNNSEDVPVAMGPLQSKHIDKLDIPFDEEVQQVATVYEKIDVYNKYTEEWRSLADRYYNELLKCNGSVPPTVNYNTAEQMHEYLEQYKNDWQTLFDSQSELYLQKIDVNEEDLEAKVLYADYEYKSYRELALYFIGVYEEVGEYNGQVF